MNISLILTIARTVLHLIPVVKEAIIQVEPLFPSGSGTEKLALVRTILQSAYDAGTNLEDKFDSVWPTLTSVITHLVPSLTKSNKQILPVM